MKRMVCIDNVLHPKSLEVGRHYLISKYRDYDNIVYQIFNLDGIINYYLNENQFLFMFQPLEEWRQSQLNKIL